ncbi:unnamed protein product [Darwinula stevensoni]|uniref:Uncharacterized protein n=1 Tax=Darwinula stevensoni TaxID=69355 RepID=A0A7R8XH80_9CRUS|nr:unnamed protein product [Darwinula stevensoni]CAG0890182.1 unnamed protein product [Darwinula stevensoni]
MWTESFAAIPLRNSGPTATSGKEFSPSGEEIIASPRGGSPFGSHEMPVLTVLIGLLYLSHVEAQPAWVREDLMGNCYFNWTVRDRFQRMPMTMGNLIGLIKKVERQPIAYYWDVYTMAANLLRRFQIDGLQFLPLNLGGSIISGSSGNSKSDLFWRMSPIGTAEDFPEDSLTVEEKCALHWMLSHSLNDTRRPEEVEGCHDRDGRHKRHAKGRNTTPDYEKSLHPLEYGVIYTDYGTVAAGQVLMGLAVRDRVANVKVADLFRDESEIVKYLNSEGHRGSQGSQSITAYYAATIAGDLAEAAAYDAASANGSQQLIGPSGTWNSLTRMGEQEQVNGTSSCRLYPSEYALADEMDLVSHATHAELHGGIDGLLLAVRIKDWNSCSLKLSQILEMYYSDRGVSLNTDRVFGACNRFNLIEAYRAELSSQTHVMAYALYLESFGLLPPPRGSSIISRINESVQKVFLQYWEFVQQSKATSCRTMCRDSKNHPPAPNVDLYVIFDMDGSEQELLEAKEVVVNLRSLEHLADNLAPMGTNRVALNISDNRRNTSTSVFDLGQEFNPGGFAFKLLKTDFRNVSSSFDFGDAMAQVRRRFQEERKFERDQNLGGTNGKVVLFVVPSSEPESSDKGVLTLEKMVRDFIKDFPDIRLNKQCFLRPTLAKRFCGWTQRMVYPGCGQSISDGKDNIFRGLLVPGTTRYMMYHGSWLNGSDNLVFKVKAHDSTSNLTVCWGRYVLDFGRLQPEEDGCGNTSDAKRDKKVMIELKHPCSRNRECDPIYISVRVANDFHPSKEPVCLGNAVACHFPDQIRYSVRHTGMKCK